MLLLWFLRGFTVQNKTLGSLDSEPHLASASGRDARWLPRCSFWVREQPDTQRRDHKKSSKPLSNKQLRLWNLEGKSFMIDRDQLKVAFFFFLPFNDRVWKSRWAHLSLVLYATEPITFSSAWPLTFITHVSRVVWTLAYGCFSHWNFSIQFEAQFQLPDCGVYTHAPDCCSTGKEKWNGLRTRWKM